MTELVLFIVFAGHMTGAALLPALLGQKMMIDALCAGAGANIEPASFPPGIAVDATTPEGRGTLAPETTMCARGEARSKPIAADASRTG